MGCIGRSYEECKIVAKLGERRDLEKGDTIEESLKKILGRHQIQTYSRDFSQRN